MKFAIILLLSISFSAGLYAQGALDVYDREATRDEEYGNPEVGKEDMDEWPMHPDKPQSRSRKQKQEITPEDKNDPEGLGEKKPIRQGNPRLRDTTP